MIIQSLEADAMKGEFLLNVMVVFFLLAAAASQILHLAFTFGWLKY